MATQHGSIYAGVAYCTFAPCKILCRCNFSFTPITWYDSSSPSIVPFFVKHKIRNEWKENRITFLTFFALKQFKIHYIFIRVRRAWQNHVFDQLKFTLNITATKRQCLRMLWRYQQCNKSICLSKFTVLLKNQKIYFLWLFNYGFFNIHLNVLLRRNP